MRWFDYTILPGLCSSARSLKGNACQEEPSDSGACGVALGRRIVGGVSSILQWHWHCAFLQHRWVAQFCVSGLLVQGDTSWTGSSQCDSLSAASRGRTWQGGNWSTLKNICFAVLVIHLWAFCKISQVHHTHPVHLLQAPVTVKSSANLCVYRWPPVLNSTKKNLPQKSPEVKSRPWLWGEGWITWDVEIT